MSRNRKKRRVLGFYRCELSCADKSTLQGDADADLVSSDRAPCEQLSHTGNGPFGERWIAEKEREKREKGREGEREIETEIERRTENMDRERRAVDEAGETSSLINSLFIALLHHESRLDSVCFGHTEDGGGNGVAGRQIGQTRVVSAMVQACTFLPRKRGKEAKRAGYPASPASPDWR